MASNPLYTELENHLFSNYSKAIRPAIDHRVATQAKLSIVLAAVDDLDEKNQVFVSSVVLEVIYIDEYLAWDPTDFGGILYLIYPQGEVWLPDLVVENSVEKLNAMGYDAMNVKIMNSGKVLWKPFEVLRTSCDIDVTYYPFDTQTCSIIVSTWVSLSTDINLIIHPDRVVNLNSYQENSAWELMKVSVTDVSEGWNQNRISFNFTIKRRKTYYILNVIIPVIALCLTSSLVFALPADAGEKIGMSITVLLAYAVYLTIISDNMPKTSMQVSILGVYLDILLVVTSLGVLFSVLILHIHHQDDNFPPGTKLRKMAIKLRPLIGLNDCRKLTQSDDESSLGSQTPVVPLVANEPSDHKKDLKFLFRCNKVKDVYHVENTATGTNKPNTDHSQNEKVVYIDPVVEKTIEVSWKHVSETVDRLLFIIFTLFIFLSSIIFIFLLLFCSP